MGPVLANQSGSRVPMGKPVALIPAGPTSPWHYHRIPSRTVTGPIRAGRAVVPGGTRMYRTPG